jgi:AcrR family transcriptional regulator
MGRTSGVDGKSRALKAAARLFYAEGIEAVSVDQVASVAGLTKRAIYYHYPSKRDLVLAYLAGADDPALALLKSFARDRDVPGRHPFASMVDGLGRWMKSGSFRGCAFLNALRAMPDDAAVTSIAKSHKERTRAWLSEVAAAHGHLHPERAAGQFLLVLDGLLGSGHLYESDELVDRAHMLLAPMLDEARSPSSAERPIS